MRWSSIRKKWVGATLVMEVIGAAVLSAIALILVYSVIRRYVFKNPDANADDWIGMLTVPAAMFALAHADVRAAHIRVQFIENLLHGTARRILKILSSTVSAVVALTVTYAMWQRGNFFKSGGVHTVQANIGVWYGYWLLAASFLAFGVQLLLRAVEAALGIEMDPAHGLLEEAAEEAEIAHGSPPES